MASSSGETWMISLGMRVLSGVGLTVWGVGVLANSNWWGVTLLFGGIVNLVSIVPEQRRLRSAAAAETGTELGQTESPPDEV
jgi:hypothetical protein